MLRRKTRENVGPFWKEIWWPGYQDMERAEINDPKGADKSVSFLLESSMASALGMLPKSQKTKEGNGRTKNHLL